MEFARNGVPFDLILARELRMPLSAVRRLPNREYAEWLAMYRLENERAARAARR